MVSPSSVRTRANARQAIVQLVGRGLQKLQPELDVGVGGLGQPDLGRIGLRRNLAPRAFIVLERILRVLGLEVGNRMKCALDIEGAHLGQRVNFEDMVGIRVRNLTGIRLPLDVMRLSSMFRPDSPDSDHPDRRATSLILNELERRGKIFGAHDLGHGQKADLRSSARDVNVAIVRRLAQRGCLRFRVGELYRVAGLDRCAVLVWLEKVVLEFQRRVRVGADTREKEE